MIIRMILPVSWLTIRHTKLLYSETNRTMQLDIFIPQLNLAFEYQGKQHYMFHYLSGHPEEQQKRDAEKKAKCAEARITLIEVPYWWDKTAGNNVCFICIQTLCR